MFLRFRHLVKIVFQSDAPTYILPNTIKSKGQESFSSFIKSLFSVNIFVHKFLHC